MIVKERKFISTLVKCVVLLLGIYFFLQIGLPSSFENYYFGGMLFSIIILQPLIIICLIVLSLRHVVVIGEPRIKISMAFRAIALAQGINILLPGRLSELLKATYLRDNAGVPLSTGLSALVLERSIDVIIITMLGAVGAIQYFDRGNFILIPIFGVVFGVVIFVIVRIPSLVLWLVHALPSVRLTNFLERVYHHFSAKVTSTAFVYALLLGASAWGLSYINIFVFFKYAGSVPIGFSGALFFFVMTTLGGAIPALPGGIGTYEAAAVITLRLLGYSFEEALVLSIILHASQFFLPFVMAVVIMFTERIGLSSLVQELRESAANKS